MVTRGPKNGWNQDRLGKTAFITVRMVFGSGQYGFKTNLDIYTQTKKNHYKSQYSEQKEIHLKTKLHEDIYAIV